MDHFFQNINGWLTPCIRKLYVQAVNKFDDKSHFVEVGAFLGKSTAFMGVEIINSEKDIRFDVIDPWGIEKCNQDNVPYGSKVSGGWNNAFMTFNKNTLPIMPYMNVFRTTSTKASVLYENKSIDFVYIDGCHCPKCVDKDIRAWLPKMKPTGIIAGHDYSHVFPGVKKAVNKYFKKFEVNGITWIHQMKPKPKPKPKKFIL